MIKDICSCFFKVLYPNYTPNHEQAMIIFKQAEKLLKKGWTTTNITNRIISYYKNNKNYRANNLYEVVPQNEVPPLYNKGNLLEDKFYFHNIF